MKPSKNHFYDLDLDNAQGPAASKEERVTVFGAIGESLTKSFSGINNSIIKAMSMGIPSKAIVLPGYPLQSFVLSPIFEGVKQIASSFKDIFSKMIEKISDFFRIIFESVRKIFQQVLQPLEAFFKSNFILIVRASKGDRMAASMLGKLWWHLMRDYMEVEKMKGRSPTKREFHDLVQEACLEVLAKEKQSGWLEAAKKVYYFLAEKLLAEYALVCDKNRKEEKLIIDVIPDQKYKSSLSLYYTENETPHLFVKTVAKENGVSAQTVRNWIKSGKIMAIKTSYLSKIRRAVIPAYLLPYHDNILKELEDLRKEQENKKLHRIEGYSTISQIIEAIPISRKTLERWDKDGKLKPKRIKNIRYYSENDVKAILFQSQSPRMKTFISEKNLALALAS